MEMRGADVGFDSGGGASRSSTTAEELDPAIAL